jgi:hypothetical protein
VGRGPTLVDEGHLREGRQRGEDFAGKSMGRGRGGGDREIFLYSPIFHALNLGPNFFFDSSAKIIIVGMAKLSACL